MLRPFQCLLACSIENSGILLAASGPCVYSFDLLVGSLLSRWPPELEDTHPSVEKSRVPATKSLQNLSTEENVSEPALKRLKNTQEEASEIKQPGRVLGDGNGQPNQVQSVVIKLAGPTKDRCIVAITEDKCIRVLQLLKDGTLTQLSERFMPKKPCSVVFTSDEKTILCGDKSGDVYKLPLIVQSQDVDAIDKGVLDELKNTSKPFIPAANYLTVHTQRNLEALRNQQRLTNQIAKKKTLKFSHQLLLGHVSLLTDLACVALVDRTSPLINQKNYILTSDRDEHIRVSRGIPQSHMIEGYCLGHTEFVSKLCIPDWDQKILISGGGDDFLLIWDWLSGTVRQRVDLRHPIDCFKRSLGSKNRSFNSNAVFPYNDNSHPDVDDCQHRIAVSGISAFRRFAADSEATEGEVIVNCEGLAALFIFSLSSGAKMQFREWFHLAGNVIDVTALHNQSTIIYSLDNYHNPSSTTVITSSEEQLLRPMIGCMSFEGSGHWKKAEYMENVIACVEKNAKAQEPAGDIESGLVKGRPLRDLLYGIENLRKRGQEDHDGVFTRDEM